MLGSRKKQDVKQRACQEEADDCNQMIVVQLLRASYGSTYGERRGLQPRIHGVRF